MEFEKIIDNDKKPIYGSLIKQTIYSIFNKKN